MRELTMGSSIASDGKPTVPDLLVHVDRNQPDGGMLIWKNAKYFVSKSLPD